MRPWLSLQTRRAPWSFGRRLDDARLAGLPVDLRDEAAGQRTPPDVARGRGADAVGPAAARRVLDGDLAGLDGDLADHAALPGEPQVALAVEGAGVEVGVGRALGQREQAHARGRASSRARSRCWPPSVSQAALSGPWITPCGDEPEPSAISSVVPLFGSNQPRWPLRCALNHTPPSGAGATSWMPVRCGVLQRPRLHGGGAQALGATTDQRDGGDDTDRLSAIDSSRCHGVVAAWRASNKARRGGCRLARHTSPA